ncbi:F-box/kelch-repeat protein At2g44130-like [Silene latifolia]|uniref:F-box/kelch-repeat protein At2g44130-like n=1 Tax=Silene latifolia TaxID=37657 RepID=UPI003D77951A
MANFSNFISTSTNLIRENNSNKFSKLCIEENELIPGLPNDIALECLLRVPISCHQTLKLVSNHWKFTLSHPCFFSLRQRYALAEHLVFLIQPLSSPSPRLMPTTSKAKVAELNEVDTRTSLLYNLSIYNSTRKEWRSLSNITIPTFAQCVTLPKLGMVIVLGGWDPATLDPVSRVVVIDLAKGIWREGSPMPTARSFFACAAAGPATVYVAGGHDGQKNALRTAEVYDVEADQWRSLPDMAEERDESHGLLLSDDSKFWVISGYGTESQGRFRSDAEIYDPETNTWTRIDGVWPHMGHTPKSTTSALRRWICMTGGELKEFNFKEKSWKVLNTGSIPKSVSESSSISIVDMGDDRMMVMGNGEKRGGECNEEGCGGEGIYVLEKTKENQKKDGINWKWEHVHAPFGYLGFPFSTSNLFI